MNEELVGERLRYTALGEHYLLSVKLRVSSFSDHFKELLLLTCTVYNMPYLALLGYIWR